MCDGKGSSVRPEPKLAAPSVGGIVVWRQSEIDESNGENMVDRSGINL